jgi:hypothetical protein
MNERATKMGDHKQSKHRGRDYFLYLGIALSVVAVAVFLGVRDAEHNVHREFKNDWTVAVGSAALAFGNVARSFWRFKKIWRFWAVLVTLIAIHFAVLMPFLSRMEKSPSRLGHPNCTRRCPCSYPGTTLGRCVVTSRRTIAQRLDSF